jgi:D-xylose transport system substrate-binding protein
MKTSNRRFWAILALFALVIVACGGDGATTTAGGTETTAATTTAAAETTAATETTAAAEEGFTVGVSWNNYNEERWAKWDEPAMKAAIEAGGGEYISADAGSSEEQQITDVENLISQGADVLIILAQNVEAIRPAVTSALEQGIPVIGYDRLIADPGALYVTFDNVGVGRMMAEVIFEEVPTGNYIIIKGNGSDANSDFLREGIEEVIGAAVSAGDITIVGETYTDNWDGALAQTETEQFLTQANNDVQAVISENDGMATGVVAALEAQGLAGQVKVSGQDGDLAALNRVALGTQSVSVWKDARELGTAAGEAAVALAGGATLADIPGTIQFDADGTSMTSIFLDPHPITQDTLNLVVDAGWITVEQLCDGVAAGAVAVCP